MEQPNLKYIKDISGGEKAFEDKLLSIIKYEFPVEMEIYYKYLKLRNFGKAAESVHKLKHKINILGLPQSYELAIAHENALREGSDSFQLKFDPVLIKMKRFLSKF